VAADPMYRQIAEDLRRQIEDGRLAPGQQLRTELELREKYNASRNTVRDAVKWLIARQLVETRPGQGTFVVEPIDPIVTTLSADPESGLGGGEGVAYMSEAKAQNRTPGTSKPKVEVQEADDAVAAELRLKKGEQIVCRHQQRFIDGTAWSLQTSFYPMRLVGNGALRLLEPNDIKDGAVKYLDEQLGIKQTGYLDKITVRVPNATETAFFGLPDDGRVNVYETFRTAFDANGVAFRLTASVFPADRNIFVIKVGDVPADDATVAATQAPDRGSATETPRPRPKGG
jgi:GntR family transcriptional regulator